MSTSRVSDEHRGSVEAVARRVILDRQPRHERAALGVAAVAGMLVVLLLIVAFAAKFAGFEGVVNWGKFSVYAGGAGCAALGLALVLMFWPVSTWGLRGDRAARRRGVQIARTWPRLVREIFPPVTDLQGHSHFPGLVRVRSEDAALVLSLGMPPVLVPGGIEGYLDTAAREIVQREGLARAEVVRPEPGTRSFALRLIPRDLTTQAREVVA